MAGASEMSIAENLIVFKKKKLQHSNSQTAHSKDR